MNTNDHKNLPYQLNQYQQLQYYSNNQLSFQQYQVSPVTNSNLVVPHYFYQPHYIQPQHIAPQPYNYNPINDPNYTTTNKGNLNDVALLQYLMDAHISYCISNNIPVDSSITNQFIPNQQNSQVYNNEIESNFAENLSYLFDLEDSSDSSTDEPKKKKSTYIPVNKFPVIVKKDFRRFFAQMMTNVLNSQDLEFMKNFFYHFSSTNFHYCESFNVASPFSTHKSSSNTILQSDLPSFLLFYLYQSAKSPDVVLSIEDIKLVQYRNDDKTYLFIKILLTSTQLYDIEEYRINNFNIFQLNNKEEYFKNLINELTYNNSKNKDLSYSTQNVSEKSEILLDKLIKRELNLENIVRLKFLNTPKQRQMLMEMKLVFDNNNKVLAIFSNQLDCH